MTLTVRLDDALASALEAYCAHRGITKSRVVHETLAAYLLEAAPAGGTDPAAARGGEPPASANYRAFAELGLVGGVALGRGGDKAAVRARVAEAFVRRQARRGGP